jgi:hypothetical protein
MGFEPGSTTSKALEMLHFKNLKVKNFPSLFAKVIRKPYAVPFKSRPCPTCKDIYVVINLKIRKMAGIFNIVLLNHLFLKQVVLSAVLIILPVPDRTTK